jgi:hypothetical protein
MALTGNGTSDFIKYQNYTAGTRYSFSFHFRSAAAPAMGGPNIPFTLHTHPGNTDIAGFSWNHTVTGFIQALYHREDPGGGYVAAKLTSSLSANTWYIIGGRYDGSNVTVWLNGSQEASSAATDPATGASAISLLSQFGTTLFIDGPIAFVGLWGAALTDAEMSALGKGFHPMLIRPGALVLAADLTRTTQARQGFTVTSSGLTVADNPRIIMPRRRAA